MTYARLKSMFPNASEEFLEKNSEDRCASWRAIPKRTLREIAMASEAGKGRDPGRTVVRIVSFRSRLIDPDNLCPKYFIDGLRYAGLLRDDSPDQITLEVRQEKVALKSDERTEITIEYEDPGTMGEGVPPSQ